MKTAILSSILTVGLGASAWAAGTPLNIAVGDSVIIDDFADGDYNSNLGPWVFSKAETSSLDTSIVDESGVKALKLDYTVSSGFRPGHTWPCARARRSTTSPRARSCSRKAVRPP